MLHKVFLETVPPGVHVISTSSNKTGLFDDCSSLYAQTSRWVPPFSLQKAHQSSHRTLGQLLPLTHSGKTSILIIDDSPTVRKILETCLTREGFQVTGFGDGITALQRLSQSGVACPALIILDITLPNMNGYEVARFLKMKPALKDMILIMLTRRDGVIDRFKGRLSGAQAYLSKPFTTQMIVTVVESYLGVPSR